MRFAVKVAYVGENFSGVARQPKKRTVEGEFLKAIKSLDFQKIDLLSVRFASRTDAGVSASCNVFCFDCEKKPNLLAIHHALPKDIACYAIAEVSEDFNLRHTYSKTYKYVLPDFNALLDVKKMQSCADVLVGVHLFHNFCHRDKRNFEREIFSIEVKKQNDSDKFVSIEICGVSFLWEMVRRIAFVLQQCGLGKINKTKLKSFLSPKIDSPVSPHEPQNLVLVAIDYGKDESNNKEKVVFKTNKKILSSWSKQINENSFLFELKAEVLRKTIDGL